MNPENRKIEALASLLDRLSATVRSDPAAVHSAWMRFQGESPDHPDPMWLAPGERAKYVSGLADEVGVSPSEMTLLFSGLRILGEHE